jgi:hypothetical protein
MKLNFNNSETAAEELNAVINEHPHLANSRAVMVTFDQLSSKLLKVTHTTVDKAISYMENARNEHSRDLTETYWDCHDSSTGVKRRGFVSHIPHNADVGYMVDLVDDYATAEEAKKAFIDYEAGLVRMPPFPPTMIDAIEGRDFDPSKLANEAGKYQEYRKLALKGVK